MQALHIHWPATGRIFTPLGVVLAAAGLLCAAWVAQDYTQADGEWLALQARQARLVRTSQPARRSSATAIPAAREASEPALQVAAPLRKPWEALLQTLERQGRKDVALVSIDAQAATGSLHLTAEAQDMEHALAYVRALRQAPALKKVYLTGQEERQAGTRKVVRFTLDASWADAP
jgi:Tfp pilus assembly protein PilN